MEAFRNKRDFCTVLTFQRDFETALDLVTSNISSNILHQNIFPWIPTFTGLSDRVHDMTDSHIIGKQRFSP